MDPLDQHMDTPIFEELRTKTLDEVKYGPGSVFAPRSGPIDLQAMPLWANPLLPAEIQHERPEPWAYTDADLPTDSLFPQPDEPKPCDTCNGTWAHATWCTLPLRRSETTVYPAQHFTVIEGGKSPEYYHVPAAPMSWPMRIALALSILVIVLVGIAFVYGAIVSHP